MKNINFKRLTLTDWRAQNKIIDFDDHTRISGRNASGKSSVWDAILWLFTGYDSFDRSNYQLFDNKIIPNKETSKPASVELSLLIDGYEYKIKRSAEMGWIRPRGAASYEKKPSDDYTFEIDGVSVPSATYKEFIENNFCSVDKLKFILNIDYYLMLDWRELRKQFADIIGDIKDSDYVGDFSDIFELISRYGNIDSAKEYIKIQRKPMRDAIGDSSVKGTKIVELETLESTLPDISGYDAAVKSMEKIKSDIANIDNEIAGRSDAIRPLIEQRNQQIAEISQLKSDLNTARIKYDSDQKAEIYKIENELSSINNENARISEINRSSRIRIEDAKRGLDSAQNKLKTLQEYREMLLEQNREVKALRFENDKCPYCGQTLPEDKLEESKASFDKEKEAKHKRIVAEGQRNNEEIERCKQYIEEYQKTINNGFTEQPVKDKSILEAKLADLKASFIPYEQSIGYKEKMAVIAEKEANITVIPNVDTEDLQQRKKELYAEQENLFEIVNNKKIYDKQKLRIYDLKEDIKNTANELAKLEGILDKFDNMEKQKAEIIRKKVSSLFSFCDIEMEERKKDGTMTPCCNIIVDGVKVQVANTASKIMAGIDISNAFSKFYQLNMPLIVDNRERLDENVNLNFDRQLIELKVSDNDFSVNNN